MWVWLKPFICNIYWLEDASQWWKQLWTHYGNRMKWIGPNTRANTSWCFKLMSWTVCDERWHQVTAYRHSHSWQQLVSGFLPGVCARLNRRMNSAFYLVLQQLVFICVTFSFAQFEFFSLQYQTSTHTRTHSLFGMPFLAESMKHDSTCDQSSATADVWSAWKPGSVCLSVCLCVSVCVWCPFMTWRYSIFTSHGSIFIISLDQECACSCYFVQWAMILGPWRQILFL